MDYVLSNLIQKDFDFTVDEYYETDRDKETWAASKAELNEVWRKIIKSQALSLKLAGKKPEEITGSLNTRYQRFSKSFAQFNAEDVFTHLHECHYGILRSAHELSFAQTIRFV
jgi:carboxyl-terminal processing protease